MDDKFMQKDQFANFLRLFHVFGIGRVSLLDLREKFGGDFNQIFNTSSHDLEAAGLTAKQIDQIKSPNEVKVEAELVWAEQPGNHIICFDDDAYPALLKQTTNYPALLYCSGNIDLLANPQIAIVGSRNCTPGGAKTAHDFAAYLSNAGITITSGMAIGIDTHAHVGALTSIGKTIAVTGTGLDKVYPAKNRQLAYDIHSDGLLVSEFPLGTNPRSDNFPRRNRIISGLSVATLVVEAARRSGSLITAHQAVEQGREVFAIPGSIHNPQVRGCHQLIREGARLADKAADIIDDLSSLLGYIASQPITQQPSPDNTQDNAKLDKGYSKLLEQMGYDPISKDLLVERSGLTIDKVSSMLLLLELKELIQSAPGGHYVRI
ncbi:MAG: DNA processing protein [Gammaproteobacteria bacterium]|jgi:DNA processing protein